jgi:GH25 family lysozyme M1 (1,4-beta-N-acetylmuramidase)
MTIYFPDVSSYQDGISLAGALAAGVKCTQGTTYYSPCYAAQVAEAQRHGAFQFSYHFLEHGAGSDQADWFLAHAGKVPAMVDCEPAYDKHGNMISAPDLTDVCQFIDRLRARGGVIHWVYLPHWWWQDHLGSADLKPLRDRGMLLWSSAYTTYSDAGSGAGWQPYGGMTPTVWQYSETNDFGGVTGNVDFNAFRGSRYAGQRDPASVAATLAEFIALSRTGRTSDTLPPVRNLAVTARFGSTVTLRWDAPQGPSPFGVRGYQVTARNAETGQDLPAYKGHPRTERKGSNPETHEYGSITPGIPVNMLVRALAAQGDDHNSPWAVVRTELDG